jgi:hypothetical protein
MNGRIATKLLRVNGGWSFVFDPSHEPRAAPAFWHPDAAPAILTLTPASSPSVAPLSLAHLRPIASRSSGPDALYLIADTARGRHRLLVRGGSLDRPLTLELPCDELLGIRLDAASRLVPVAKAATGYLPTRLQRSRLVLLLRILDAEQAGLSKHAIAERLMYPHMRRLHGATWKGSAERRRTYRLCQEAARLRDQGVFDLLKGQLHPPG